MQPGAPRPGRARSGGSPGCGLPLEPRPVLLEWQRLPAVS